MIELDVQCKNVYRSDEEIVVLAVVTSAVKEPSHEWEAARCSFKRTDSAFSATVHTDIVEGSTYVFVLGANVLQPGKYQANVWSRFGLGTSDVFEVVPGLWDRASRHFRTEGQRYKN